MVCFEQACPIAEKRRRVTAQPDATRFVEPRSERKLVDGTLAHDRSRLMAWAVGNSRVEPRGNAIAITKQASETAKIDPLMATFNAVALMAMNPKASGRSYLRSEQLLVL